MKYSLKISYPKYKIKQFEFVQPNKFQDETEFKKHLETYQDIRNLANTTDWPGFVNLPANLQTIFLNFYYTIDIIYDEQNPSYQNDFLNYFNIKSYEDAEIFKDQIKQAYEKLGYRIGYRGKPPIIKYKGVNVKLWKTVSKIPSSLFISKENYIQEPTLEIFEQMIDKLKSEGKINLDLEPSRSYREINTDGINFPIRRLDGSIIHQKLHEYKFVEINGVKYWLPSFEMISGRESRIAPLPGFFEAFKKKIGINICPANIKYLFAEENNIDFRKLFEHIKEFTGSDYITGDTINDYIKRLQPCKDVKGQNKYPFEWNGENYYFITARNFEQYFSLPKAKYHSIYKEFQSPSDSIADGVLKKYADDWNKKDNNFSLYPQKQLIDDTSFKNYITSLNLKITRRGGINVLDLLNKLFPGQNEVLFKVSTHNFFENQDIDQEQFIIKIENQNINLRINTSAYQPVEYDFTGEILCSPSLYSSDLTVYDTNGNLRLILEFDGAFHFQSGGRGPLSNEKLLKKVISDQLKNDFCRKYNVKLVRIPCYKVFPRTLTSTFYSYIDKIIREEIYPTTQPTTYENIQTLPYRAAVFNNKLKFQKK